MERLVAAYLDHLVVERGVSEHTLGAYRRDLARYTAWLARAGVDEPSAVTPALVGAYASSLAEGVPGEDGAPGQPALAPASVARAVVAVRSLHRFAVADGLTASDPAADVHPPRPARRLPKALSLEQVQTMLDLPATETVEGLRDAALLELLYGTGGRISEVVDLDVDDLTRALAVPPDELAGLRVLGKGGKERVVPLGSYARAAVEAYLVRGRPALASKGRGTPALLLNARGARLSRQSAYAVLRRVADQAGVPGEVSPHTLRHSFATHLIDGGADVRVVQELLGHASVTTTQIYTLVTVDHLREVYAGAHPRAR
ncbi:integrase/recombinase XerD [Microlunatus sagamiharensis]|uniref:Tyrosine recombinase XerD n=1 Tax=Microlunatus sagamiharensis TaxID=546874 RepID=A0A1H2LYN3_9ACTN|nr:site-specific tyrosine recombinase XerD [Microlunatus sagamiharensis]SDU85396.1 integrase/recombinase XerD [Microlunatus sagamiharensis]